MPRYQHTVTATGDGSAAVIFGGLSAADVMPEPSRWRAVHHGDRRVYPFAFMPGGIDAALAARGHGDAAAQRPDHRRWRLHLRPGRN